MLYEAKEGTKAYEYIKGVLDAEEKERQAYIERVDKAVGFEFEKYRGYEALDKKIWRKFDSMKLEDGYYIAVAPNKRYKHGKAIATVLASYKAVTDHFKILKELGIEPPQAPFSITQLLRCYDHFFAFFDDSIRAEKSNPDFKEITIGEYEDLINSYNEQKNIKDYVM